jgi:hypothetical protein
MVAGFRPDGNRVEDVLKLPRCPAQPRKKALTGRRSARSDAPPGEPARCPRGAGRTSGDEARTTYLNRRMSCLTVCWRGRRAGSWRSRLYNHLPDRLPRSACTPELLHLSLYGAVAGHSPVALIRDLRVRPLPATPFCPGKRQGAAATALSRSPGRNRRAVAGDAILRLRSTI